jgi:S1 RNA binding domain protein
MALEIGNVLEGKVIKIMNFGAFVELSTGETGLIRISEVDDSYVRDVRDFLREGDKVKVKVVAIKEDGKIDLSLRQAKQGEGGHTPQRAKPVSRTPNEAFERMLKQFKKQSKERLESLNKERKNKRS